ncbi:MAG: hypothetical protein PUC47_08880 [Oscillospiraceae bacterium]|nr:hypothetical protein [Oscillospiraceae bacterium]
MPAQVTNYQCPACTGPLHFSSSSGKLECDYCGSSFEVAEIEALYAKKDEAAAAAAQPAQPVRDERTVNRGPDDEIEDEVIQDRAEEEKDPEAQWIDDSADDLEEPFSGSTDWGGEAEGMHAYSCPSCGAELICDATTAATSCPYCGNPTIVPGQFAGALRPDFVIPFKVSREEAVQTLKKHYKKNFFLPKVFSEQNHIEEIRGVYVPFWLMDASVSGDAEFHGRRVTVHRSGDYEITTTRHYQVSRGGSADFVRVPVDGSSKMRDDYMDSLEPFDYSELKPFSTAYLPGYLADKYDVGVKESGKRADRRCKQSMADLLQQDVTGYTSVTLNSMKSSIRHGKVQYALLPVWMLSTRWKDQTYLFAMNGQTGKFIGEMPTSKSKFWSVTALAMALLTALFYCTGIARGILNMISWLGA